MTTTSRAVCPNRIGMLHFKGRDWWPQEFAVCMAMDAFRLCLFGKPSNFTKREVLAWIEAVGEKHD